ncbi:MAG: methionine--tRNA ligase [Planctomycetaceae bacterium]|jgi:methionyl-tRNA synthetase|nr:methionine--tRNA ligase [Planctomycetaceae bacterium]
MKRKILVTSGLPYANGHIHIGHLVEYIQTDIWVRFQKLVGNDAVFICGDDTHGTTMMLRARAEGCSEESIIERMHAAHVRDFSGFDVNFDYYGTTHCEENRQLCNEIWAAIKKAGLIEEREIEQLYDVEANTFLADRFVKGTCPVCGKKDQFGDNCECGAHYSPTDLADVVSTITGTKPELRKAKHLFVNIEREHKFLDQWVHSGTLQPEIANYLTGQFLNNDLRFWDVSRPAPYFGFEIPDSPNNYWYVWFDAPTGYIAATWQWCKLRGLDFGDFWRNPNTEVHHFIGKDITYFHTLFWPVMLKVAGLTLPKKVHIHGFLTVNGEKMAKRRGTFILASTFLKHLNPAYLRYFYAAKTTGRVDDLDLNFEELENRVNSDLVGNLVNIASRTAKFVQKIGLSASYPDDGGLFAQGVSAGNEIVDAYENCDYGKVIRLVMECGNRANKFIDNAAPWQIRDDANRQQELQDICTIGLNLFRQMIVYLLPILPSLKSDVERLLNVEICNWDDSGKQIVGTKVSPYKHLITRVERAAIERIVEESKQPETGNSNNNSTNSNNTAANNTAADTANNALKFQDSDEALKAEPLLVERVSIDDFTKVDLRVARVIEAEEVEGARKLLKLRLSLGGDEQRQVFAGIKSAYKASELVGRLVVCVANLQPRQMKFGLSEGMVVAAGGGGNEIFLISPDNGAKPGMRLH